MDLTTLVSPELPMSTRSGSGSALMLWQRPVVGPFRPGLQRRHNPAPPQELVDDGSNRFVRDRHGARWSSARVGLPELLEYASNLLDVTWIPNHGPDALSLDPCGTACFRDDQGGDTHRNRFIELGRDLQLLFLCQNHGQARTGYHVQSLGAR